MNVSERNSVTSVNTLNTSNLSNLYNIDYYTFRHVVDRETALEREDKPDLAAKNLSFPNFQQSHPKVQSNFNLLFNTHESNAKIDSFKK